MASKTDPCKSESINLLFPDMLSREELIVVLNLRRIRKIEFENLSKKQLLELFYKYVSPLPQREWRSNRRGTKMNTARLKQEALKRKSEDKTEDDSGIVKCTKREANVNHVRALEDRLKQSPSSASTNSNNITTKSNSSSSNSRTEHRHNSSSSSSSSSHENSVIVNNTYTSSRKIKLKRNSDATPTKEKTHQTPVTENTQEQKRKHEPITWP